MRSTTRGRAWSRLIGLAAIVAFAATGCGSDSAPALVSVRAELSPILADRDAEPMVRLLQPFDGDEVTSPFTLVAALENSELAPKGHVRDGEGHLHVLIDLPCVTPGTVIPDDVLHIHVGTGAESVELDLEPGERHLCVQIGDGFHSATTIQAELTVFVME